MIRYFLKPKMAQKSNLKKLVEVINFFNFLLLNFAESYLYMLVDSCVLANSDLTFFFFLV